MGSEEPIQMGKSQRSEIYANEIKMSGLPFMLQGWNCVFKKTKDQSEGCPVYRLDPYTLYFFIPIIGVEIKKVNGIWILQRDCDSLGQSFIIQKDKNEFYPGDVPYGTWKIRGLEDSDANVVPMWENSFW